MTFRFRPGFGPLLALVLLACLPARAIDIFSAPGPQIEFALSELYRALDDESIAYQKIEKIPDFFEEDVILIGTFGDPVLLQFLDEEAKRAAGSLKPEGFLIRVLPEKRVKRVLVIGADEAGAMYGGLELAETIRISGLQGVANVEQNPYMAMRGTKFNIPLDVRTPSYTDPCDAAQQNIAEMWNWDFWKEYIDNLARYRYNFVSLWNLHPFPSMVKVPDYPDVALDDVQRSTVKWKELYSLNGVGFDAPEIINNVEILKKMTIDEKIDFWRRVMDYGKKRNVRFYVVTWNIFINGTNGKYGITDDIDNPVTIDYFRKSVKQMFLTYPDLAGVGLTTGENMPDASVAEKEDWAFKTYGMGVLDAAKELPGRNITLIHRQHQTGAVDIARTFKSLSDNPDINFIFSFKYAQAHVYSSTTQTFHPAFVRELQSEGDLKTIWTLRNDDIYYFRWGGPDFVREFVNNIPYDVSLGYYYGSDQYIWGREFLSLEPDSPRQIEISKHWYQWMLWGRLGYNPEIPNERFEGIVGSRFPGADAHALFTAWQEASMIYPKTTGFHWGSLDFQWYIESSKSHYGPTAQTPSGFHDINRFITLPPHPGTPYEGIPDYVENSLKGIQSGRVSPYDVADQIQAHSEKALANLALIKYNGDRELRKTLDDIRTISFLGLYYAHKIRAATELAFLRATFKKEHQQRLAEELNLAAYNWRRYASLALSHYKNPLWTNRVGYVDWRKLYEHVLYDLTICGVDKNLPSMEPTPGGRILEAEEANTLGQPVSDRKSGFTGAGYVDVKSRKQAALEWTFDAPQSGRYVLELRYSGSANDPFLAQVKVNGEPAGDLALWQTGGEGTWAWDRITVTLKQGRNAIRIPASRSFLIDHLNVLWTGESD